MLQITAAEEDVFKALLTAAASCNLVTQFRVTGGWVRDKLLGVQSHDIDITLDNMTGMAFREEISDCLRSMNAITSKVQQKNSESSMHLETSSVEIYGRCIDLGNLRWEEYNDESRTPERTGIGTPIQDAYRRDFTINSLFYNLVTGVVEDFTGKGLADLKTGIIRTPRPPLVMFLEDPLRIFRAVRFATRFGFELDPELRQAASSPRVHVATSVKLRQGRVVEEGRKMIFGNDPLRAMRLLRELGYMNHLFPMPAGLEVPENWESVGVKCMVTALELMDVLNISNENLKCVVALASLLLPLKDLVYIHDDGKSRLLSSYVIKDRLLYNGNEATEVASLVASIGNSHMDAWFEENKLDLMNGKPVYFKGDYRVEAGLLLNDLLLLKGARDCYKENSTEAFVAVMSAYKCTSGQEAVCKGLKAAIVNSGLYKFKGVLSGKDVLDAGGVPGREIGSWLQRLLIWQLQNEGASSDECKTRLKNWIQMTPSSSDADMVSNKRVKV